MAISIADPISTSPSPTPTTYLYAPVGNFAEKIGGVLGIKPISVNQILSGEMRILMPDALADDLQAVLADYMDQHGYRPSSRPGIVHATTPVVLDTKELPKDWGALAGVLTNPSYFVPDLNRLIGQITAEVRSDNDGAALRIVEKDLLTREENDLGKWPIPNTKGEWQPATFNTERPPGKGDHVYRVEGICGDGTAALRFATLVLIELLLVPA